MTLEMSEADPGQLEIIMSLGGRQVRQVVSRMVLDRAGDPRRIVEQHAALMFEKLQEEISKL